MNEYESYISERKITRLCHFTKSKNLPKILDRDGKILANNFIKEDLEKNDLNRIDGKEDYICCSIEYPNVYDLYELEKRNRLDLFKEFSILLISPSVINDQTLFCPCNAATESGKLIRSGLSSFKSLYKSRSVGKMELNRTKNMSICSPTDNQAEVLIRHSISKTNIKGIVFRDQAQAKKELNRLEIAQCDLSTIKIFTCADMYDKNLANKLRAGDIPEESLYME